MLKEVKNKLKNPANWVATAIMVGVLVALGVIAWVSGMVKRLKRKVA